MDLTYNKVDQTALPISTTRVVASEYNQIAGSLMDIITASQLTPDAADNTQLLNAIKTVLAPFIVNKIMPTTTSEQLTLGASGASYQMPDDGWLYIDKTAGTTNAYVVFKCGDMAISGEYATVAPLTGNHCTLLMPVKKGVSVTVNYSATGTTNYFRFIYAEGNK